MKLSCVVLLITGSLFAQPNPAVLDKGFDKPLKQTVVDFGPSPYYRPSQGVKRKLTCYSYPTFTVKQYDEGQKGAEWLSVVPSSDARCTQKHTENEKIYKWWGYFWGAKGKYAIFTAPDGVDGGVPFAIFDTQTGRKLFEDSSLLEYYQDELNIQTVFHIASGAEPPSRLTYFRVVRADCNLKTEPTNCWNKVRAKFGITQTDSPICREYEQAEWESVLVYPVSVLLTDSPQIKPSDGPIFCWPTN